MTFVVIQLQSCVILGLLQSGDLASPSPAWPARPKKIITISLDMNISFCNILPLTQLSTITKIEFVACASVTSPGSADWASLVLGCQCVLEDCAKPWCRRAPAPIAGRDLYGLSLRYNYTIL